MKNLIVLALLALVGCQTQPPPQTKPDKTSDEAAEAYKHGATLPRRDLGDVEQVDEPARGVDPIGPWQVTVNSDVAKLAQERADKYLKDHNLNWGKAQNVHYSDAWKAWVVVYDYAKEVYVDPTNRRVYTGGWINSANTKIEITTQPSGPPLGAGGMPYKIAEEPTKSGALHDPAVTPLPQLQRETSEIDLLRADNAALRAYIKLLLDQRASTRPAHPAPGTSTLVSVVVYTTGNKEDLEKAVDGYGKIMSIKSFPVSKTLDGPREGDVVAFDLSIQTAAPPYVLDELKKAKGVVKITHLGTQPAK